MQGHQRVPDEGSSRENMKGAYSKLSLIVVLVLLCVYSVVPPEQKIRLGKDLRGGVSLVYAVSIPDDANSEQVISQVIEVLKQRVNPQGVLDITFQPQGANRMEVVMPLPSPEVRALQKTFQQELETLSRQSSVTRASLEAALNSGTAVDRFGGQDPDRRARLATLQKDYTEALDARAQLSSMMDDPNADDVALAELQDRVARAELRSDEMMGEILSARLSEARVLEILSLPGKDRVTTLDDGTTSVTPSDRTVQLAALEVEFPYLATQLTSLAGTYAEYVVADAEKAVAYWRKAASSGCGSESCSRSCESI